MSPIAISAQDTDSVDTVQTTDSQDALDAPVDDAGTESDDLNTDDATVDEEDATTSDEDEGATEENGAAEGAAQGPSTLSIQPAGTGTTNTKITTVSIKESSIAHDGTFTIQATTYQNFPVTPGDTTTITFPDNIIVPDGTWDVYNTWFNRPEVVTGTVTVTNNVATITIAQGMQDLLVEWGNYGEYYLYPEIPGASFVDQASLGGTTQSVTFTTSDGGPFTDSVFIQEGPAAPEPAEVRSVSIKEGSIATDGTFTIDITTWQTPPVVAGSTSTVTFPSNIIVPDGTWDVYNTWFGEPDLITGTVTVSGNVATITVRQEMVDFLDRHNWGEYYLYPSIPGAKFVDQETLGGTWQSATFTTSNGGPFTDKVYILPAAEAKDTKILSTSIREGIIATDGTFTIDITTYQTPPITAGSTSTVVFPDNIIVPDGTWDVYNTWFGEPDLITGTVTVVDNVATITIRQEMVDFLDRHNWGEYYLYPSIPGAKFVDQETLGGTWQEATFTTSNGGPFTDKVYILGEAEPTDPKVLDVHVAESVIPIDGTFTIKATTYQVPPLTAGTSYTITFPDNIIVPNGEYPVYDVWWDSSVVAATVKVENGIGTVTIEQGMVDLVEHYNWFEYYLYPSIPGAKFVNQETLGGTWQDVVFESSNGGPFNDKVYVLPSQPEPDPTAPKVTQVHIKESVISVDDTFTILATTWQKPPLVAGTSYTITFPDNIIVPDGTYPVNDVWWDSSVVVANVTVVDGVGTVTIEQGMVDLVTKYNWFEYYLYPSIPGAKFVNQAALGGTWQSGTFTSSNGGPFTDNVFILPETMENDPSKPGVGDVSVENPVIPVEGCFTVDATVNYTAPVEPNSAVRMVFPANVIVKDGDRDVTETLNGQAVVVAKVSVKNNVATITATQGLADYMAAKGLSKYDLVLEFPCVTFVGQENLGGTRQSVTITASNGGPHSFTVTILPDGFGDTGTPTVPGTPTDPSKPADPVTSLPKTGSGVNGPAGVTQMLAIVALAGMAATVGGLVIVRKKA